MPTRRRRFLWAAWWEAPPEEAPFRKPDAASGGARTREEAHAAAEAAAGRTLVDGGPRWAAAWSRVLRGDPPWPPRAEPKAAAERHATVVPRGSKPWAFALLGLPATASAEEIRRAFRSLALQTHPDVGGDSAAFIDAKRAYDVALRASAEGKRRRRRAR